MVETTMIKAFGPTHMGSDALPWHPFTPYSDEILLKLFHIDPVKGEVIGLLKVPGGVGLATHNHYGRVLVYTVQGSWRLRRARLGRRVRGLRVRGRRLAAHAPG